MTDIARLLWITVISAGEDTRKAWTASRDSSIEFDRLLRQAKTRGAIVHMDEFGKPRRGGYVEGDLLAIGSVGLCTAST